MQAKGSLGSLLCAVPTSAASCLSGLSQRASSPPSAWQAARARAKLAWAVLYT